MRRRAMNLVLKRIEAEVREAEGLQRVNFKVTPADAGQRVDIQAKTLELAHRDNNKDMSIEGLYDVAVSAVLTLREMEATGRSDEAPPCR